jgi:stage V sporulation protein K
MKRENICDFLASIRANVIGMRQPFTWAHVTGACFSLAGKHSSYRTEPLLQTLMAELQRRILAKIGVMPDEPGLNQEQIVEIVTRLDAWDSAFPRLEWVHDRFLRWIASGEAGPGDWTLPLIQNLLSENHLLSGNFDGTVPWNTSRQEGQTSAGKPWSEELDALVGLNPVKTEVRAFHDFLRVMRLRNQRGFPAAGLSLHQVFMGSPGTGKTTVARILARIYHEFGFLSKGHLVETDRAGLVGAVIGATEAKTEEAIRNAAGGVLFIDEAYSLATDSQQDFGQRAIDTLVKAMEDKRGNLVVIVAGYEDRMQHFVQANPGLTSRFNRYIRFPDYGDDELLEIFRRLSNNEHFKIEAGAPERIISLLANRRLRLGERFGNARDVRTLWEMCLQQQAVRLCSSFPEMNVPDDNLLTLACADVPSEF